MPLTKPGFSLPVGQVFNMDVSGLSIDAQALGYPGIADWLVAKGYGTKNNLGGVSLKTIPGMKWTPAAQAVYLALAADLESAGKGASPGLMGILINNGLATKDSAGDLSLTNGAGTLVQPQPTATVQVQPSDPTGGNMQSSNLPAKVNNGPDGPPQNLPMKSSGLSTPVKVAIGVGIFGVIVIAANPKIRTKLAAAMGI